MVSHPPYSPDLAPSDFHLFPELKKNLGGTQFQTDEEVQNAVVNFLHRQAAEFYHSGLKKWVPRMQKCIQRNGDYVEK
ncbi:histone-lysine N-methyltransferase SETMAR [Trichonephila clavipes]|nr:histone-lysine N-methyltransferase SETMAR [Trichonephila clavipes]